MFKTTVHCTNCNKKISSGEKVTIHTEIPSFSNAPMGRADTVIQKLIEQTNGEILCKNCQRE